jgi:hypothetical protein
MRALLCDVDVARLSVLLIGSRNCLSYDMSELEPSLAVPKPYRWIAAKHSMPTASWRSDELELEHSRSSSGGCAMVNTLKRAKSLEPARDEACIHDGLR